MRFRRIAHRAPRFPGASRAPRSPVEHRGAPRSVQGAAEPRSAAERLRSACGAPRSAAIKQTNRDQGNSNTINQSINSNKQGPGRVPVCLYCRSVQSASFLARGPGPQFSGRSAALRRRSAGAPGIPRRSAALRGAPGAPGNLGALWGYRRDFTGAPPQL